MPLPPEQDEPIFSLSHVLLMYGGRTQVPTVVQGETVPSGGSEGYSITLTLVLSYLRPHLQRWQSQGPQASTGQEQGCHSVDCGYLPLRINWGWIRLESYLGKANRCWILCPCSWLYFSILEVRSNLGPTEESCLPVFWGRSRFPSVRREAVRTAEGDSICRGRRDCPSRIQPLDQFQTVSVGWSCPFANSFIWTQDLIV